MKIPIRVCLIATIMNQTWSLMTQNWLVTQVTCNIELLINNLMILRNDSTVPNIQISASFTNNYSQTSVIVILLVIQISMSMSRA